MQLSYLQMHTIVQLWQKKTQLNALNAHSAPPSARRPVPSRVLLILYDQEVAATSPALTDVQEDSIS